MREETYLDICLLPSELNINIEKIIMTKLKERYLFKEFNQKMITNIKLNNLNNTPLSKSLSNNIELNIPVIIDYKTYKINDIIYGELFSNDKDDRVFVISHDIICEILNSDIIDKIISKNHIKVILKILKIQMDVFIF